MISDNPSVYNSTEVTLVGLPSDMKEGVVSLPGLVKQALHDEKDLATGVNRKSVIQRHHHTLDRMHFLAQLALAKPETPKLSLPAKYLSDVSKNVTYNAKEFRNARLLSAFTPQEGLSATMTSIDSSIGRGIMKDMLERNGRSFRRRRNKGSQ